MKSALASLLLASCSASSNIGVFIPKHHRSDVRKGEHTQLYCAPQSIRSGSTLALGATAATMAVGYVGKVAFDAANAEFKREAKRYEHSYKDDIGLTLQEIREDGHFVFIRWVDKSVGFEDFSAAKAALLEKSSGLAESLTEIESKVPTGKVPACILTARIEGSYKGFYRLRDCKLWLSCAGAKVLAVNSRNAYKFWQWVGAIIFRSDGELAITSAFTAEAWQESKEGGKMAPISTSAKPFADIKIDLDELPKVYDLSDDGGVWLPLPQIAESKGIYSFAISIAEKDSSNAQQYVTDLGNSVEGERTKTIDMLKKLFSE